MKISAFLKKLKIKLPYDQAIPLLGIYSKELKSAHCRDIGIATFVMAIFTIFKL
jgi:hypothetical protein